MGYYKDEEIQQHANELTELLSQFSKDYSGDLATPDRMDKVSNFVNKACEHIALLKLIRDQYHNIRGSNVDHLAEACDEHLSMSEAAVMLRHTMKYAVKILVIDSGLEYSHYLKFADGSGLSLVAADNGAYVIKTCYDFNNTDDEISIAMQEAREQGKMCTVLVREE